MWMFLIVILPPGFDRSPRIAQTREPVGFQTFIPHTAVKASRVGILYRLARLNKLQSNAPFCTPSG